MMKGHRQFEQDVYQKFLVNQKKAINQKGIRSISSKEAIKGETIRQG